MKFKLTRIVGLLTLVSCFALLSAQALAQDPAPVAMLKSVSQQLLQQLSNNQRRLKNNPGLVRSIVKRVVLPHINVCGMSRNVVGRFWRNATSAEKKQFVDLFQRQVIRTYSSAFANYAGETVRFYPYRGKVGTGPIQVRSLVLNQSQHISLNYIVTKYGATWKVIDFIVDGVSMTNSYRAQFQTPLAEGGLNLLNKRLLSRYH